MIRNILLLLLALTLAASIAWTIGRPDEVPFHKHEIDLGANEPCAFADINGDGKLDIVSGENWYDAPRWTRHKFRSLSEKASFQSKEKAYSRFILLFSFIAYLFLWTACLEPRASKLA